MIITRDTAQNLTKERLAEIATEYSNGFIQKLGIESKIKINPDEVIFDSKEAEEFFCIDKPIAHPSLYKNHSAEAIQILKNTLRSTHNIEREFIKSHINKKIPFIKNNVVYIPLCEFNEAPQTIENWVFFKKLDDKDYLCLGGFSAEIGHLIYNKISIEKTKDYGISEAADIFSQLYGMQLNCINLGVNSVSNNTNLNKDNLQQKVLSQETRQTLDRCLNSMADLFFTAFTYELELTELFFHKGRKKATKCLLKKGLDRTSIGMYLLDEVMDFANTSHYEGLKLFKEIFSYAKKDSNRAYKKFGELLYNPDVVDIYDALWELDLPKNELEKFKLITQDPKRRKTLYL